jgi:hypothetical protein
MNRFRPAVAFIGLLCNGLTPGARADAWNNKIQRRSPSDLGSAKVCHPASGEAEVLTTIWAIPNYRL